MDASVYIDRCIVCSIFYLVLGHLPTLSMNSNRLELKSGQNVVSFDDTQIAFFL